VVSQPERDPVPLAPPIAPGIDRLGCLPWVLLALVLVLLVVVIVLLVW
jgi:hypothetical protein